MNTLKWRRDPFRVINYAFCPDKKIWNELRKRQLKYSRVDIGDYPSSSGMTTAWVSCTGPRALVTLQSWCDDSIVDAASVIAHEAVHVAYYISARMVDTPSEETQAYLIGGVVEKLLKTYIKTRKPRGC